MLDLSWYISEERTTNGYLCRFFFFFFFFEWDQHWNEWLACEKTSAYSSISSTPYEILSGRYILEIER